MCIIIGHLFPVTNGPLKRLDYSLEFKNEYRSSKCGDIDINMYGDNSKSKPCTIDDFLQSALVFVKNYKYDVEIRNVEFLKIRTKGQQKILQRILNRI